MSKIVAFVGSPRKNGFSTTLLNQVLEGAKAAGAEVVVYDLNGENIKGCQGCSYCRTHEGCATQDSLQPMYKDIQEATGIVASFPIYMCGISAQAKAWLDRMYPMWDNSMVPRYPGKKAVAIYSQGNGDPNCFKNTIDGNNMFFNMFGWDLVKSFLLHNTSDPNTAIEEIALQEAYNIGQTLI